MSDQGWLSAKGSRQGELSDQWLLPLQQLLHPIHQNRFHFGGGER